MAIKLTKKSEDEILRQSKWLVKAPLDFNHSSETGFEERTYAYAAEVQIFYVVGTLLCFLVSSSIIVVNTMYIICLYINRRKEWFSHTKNILSIVIIDLTVGITSLWMTVTISMSNVPFYTCALSQSLCLSANITTTLSILRLCVLRIISVRRTTLAKESSTGRILLQTFLAYTLSSGLCFSPVFFWSKYSPKLRRCTWSELFQENTSSVDTFILVILLIPILLTTILYIFLLLYIRKRHRVIFPGTATYSNQATVWSTVRSKTNSQATDTSRATDSHDGNNLETTSSCKSSIRPTHSDAANSFASNVLTGRSQRHDMPMSHVIARQRRLSSVVKTIGAILLCANTSVLPLIIMLVLKIVDSDNTSPMFSFFASLMLMLNSIADPIIYAVTLKHLREAFKKLLSKLLPCK